MPKKFILFLLILFFAQNSQATEKVIANGQLIGADNVLVGGSLFNVRFMGGSCNSLFNNCDLNNFAFDNQTDAKLASEALLDSVFIDDVFGNHDSDADLTNGCSNNTEQCLALTPYSIEGNLLSHWIAENQDNETGDTAEFGGVSIRSSGTTFLATYAKWTPVPIPAAAWLFMSGLMVLVFNARRKSNA